ncbi:MAG: oligosaccharide flippase family protein [Clostridia bacterium]|nr:oligosaccharide flippase family protein [Clostridia bacterium]
MKKTLFIKNAAILTTSSLILRFAGIVFKVWLAAKIGSEGIGLYQLIFSVYMFAATFATSGISTAVTRLVSEELAIGSKQGIKRILKRCIELSCVIAAITIAILFFGADFISNHLLHEARAALSLKILAFSLPFMSICSCIKGYFIARRKAAPSSVSQLLEQAIRIALIMPLVTRYNGLGLEYTCAAVLFGDTVAEAASCLYVYIRYKLDFKNLKILAPATKKQYKLLPAISHIALPITSGRYLNSLLRMIENILVPICLTKSVNGGNGISLFGMIKGMALPVLFFPSTLLGALSTLLLPEMSEAAARSRMGVVRSISYRIIKITSLVSIIFSALFMVGGQKFGMLIYKNADVGFLLRALSPIVPFMYLDAIADGILKGLDQQRFTFRTSVGDSAIRIVLILLLLNRYGIYGFIGIMYFSNFLTGFLNVRRLIKVSGLKLDLAHTFFLPTLGACTVCLGVDTLMKLLFNMSDLFFSVVLCVVCITLYLIYLWVLGIIDRDDISFIRQK